LGEICKNNSKLSIEISRISRNSFICTSAGGYPLLGQQKKAQWTNFVMVAKDKKNLCLCYCVLV
jgi:hypothetical protein